MHGRVALALASLALAAAPAVARGADDGVVVIRGSDVSVARPLTPERVRDGSAEVEVIRVEVPPARRLPPPPPPERELVVVLLPPAEPPSPMGIPVGWAGAWPWMWPWRPGLHPHRVPRGHFPPTFHPLGIHTGPVRSGFHTR